MTRPWMIYGANGYTGELVAREAAARGLKPVLAGRNAQAVTALAMELGCESRAFGLDDPEALRGHLDGVGSVLHCAGPFVITSPPMVDACLALGLNYLDITGEVTVFETVLRRRKEAEAAGAVLLPGAGFDVVPSDCLAARLAAALPDATHLELAFISEGGSWSRGTLATMIENLPHAGAERRDGKLVPLPAAYDSKQIDFPHARRWVATIPWGDIATAYRTTRIPNIRVYTGMPLGTIRRLRRWRWALPIAALGPIKRYAQRRVRRQITGPDADVRASARTYLWGEVRNAQGARVSATLTVPEAYRFTATTAVECTERVHRGDVKPGAWTPGGAFGADFVAQFAGVEVGALVRQGPAA